MSNNFFDAQRFTGLLKSQLMENKNQYGLFFLGCTILLVAIWLIYFVFPASERGIDEKLIIFGFINAWAISGLFFTVRYFKILKGKGAAILYLLRPASVFEKWLAALVVVSILYPVCFAIVYFSVSFLFTLSLPLSLFSDRELFKAMIYIIYYQPILIFFCIYLKKNVLFKVLIVYFIIPIFFGIFSYPKYGYYLFELLTTPYLYLPLSYFALKNQQA